MQQANGVAAVGHTKTDGNAIYDFECYDVLPRPVRDALKETVGRVWSEQLMQLWLRHSSLMGHQSCLVTMLDYMLRGEMLEVLAFSREFQSKYNIPYPHVAARATILRYGKDKPALRQSRLRVVGQGSRARAAALARAERMYHQIGIGDSY